MSNGFRDKAQSIACKLSINTTCIDNVLLIQSELEDAYAEGASSMLRLCSNNEAKNPEFGE